MGNRENGFALGVAVVADEVECELFPLAFEESLGVLLEARFLQQGDGCHRIVGKGRDLRVVPIGLDRVGARSALTLAIQDVIDDLIDVDRHPEGLANPGVVEGWATKVVTDVRVPETEGREGLIGRILQVAGRLMRLRDVGVDRAGTELDLPSHGVGDDPNVELAVLGRLIEILVVATQMNHFVGAPVLETEGPRSDG